MKRVGGSVISDEKSANQNRTIWVKKNELDYGATADTIFKEVVLVLWGTNSDKTCEKYVYYGILCIKERRKIKDKVDGLETFPHLNKQFIIFFFN